MLLTFDETLDVIYVIQSNYPNFYSKQTGEQAEIMTKLWARVFNDYSQDIVITALMAIILKKKDFPPNIAEINEQIVKMTNPQVEILDGETAWGEAQRIMNDYGAYLFPEQVEEMNNEIAKFPMLFETIRACGHMEALRACEMDNLGTLRAQFIRIYNSYSKRQQDNLLLPQNIKSEISEIQQNNIGKANNVINFLANKLSI